MRYNNYFITGDRGSNNSEVKLASTRDQVARISTELTQRASFLSVNFFSPSTPAPSLRVNTFQLKKKQSMKCNI